MVCRTAPSSIYSIYLMDHDSRDIVFATLLLLLRDFGNVWKMGANVWHLKLAHELAPEIQTGVPNGLQIEFAPLHSLDSSRDSNGLYLVCGAHTDSPISSSVAPLPSHRANHASPSPHANQRCRLIPLRRRLPPWTRQPESPRLHLPFRASPPCLLHL